MNPFRFLLLIIILCFPLSIAAQSDFSNIESFLKSTLKADGRLGASAQGDLNGDGRPDWAGVVHRRPPDSSPTYQLYVLMRQRSGGYQIAEKSIEEEIAGMGCCWLEDLRIRRSSIFIQNNAKTATVMEAVTHQFRLNQNEWRLVGIKSYYTDHGPDTPGTVDTDINLLTGLIIEKSQKGKRKPIVKSRRKKFPVYLLKDFDFSIRFGNE